MKKKEIKEKIGYSFLISNARRGRPRDAENQIKSGSDPRLEWLKGYSAKIAELGDRSLGWHFQIQIRRECAKLFLGEGRRGEDCQAKLARFASLIEKGPIVTIRSAEKHGISIEDLGLGKFFSRISGDTEEDLVAPLTVGKFTDMVKRFTETRIANEPAHPADDPYSDWFDPGYDEYLRVRCSASIPKLKKAFESYLRDLSARQTDRTLNLEDLRSYGALQYIDLALWEAQHGIEVWPAAKAKLIYREGTAGRSASTVRTTTFDQAVLLLDEFAVPCTWLAADAMQEVIGEWNRNDGQGDGEFLLSRAAASNLGR